ncbi:peroxiredoxin (alkyl hydroperoxide reductase subunit C) [Galdieria sulphuraria]|uniref:Peroxiredoxin (Alkyl hydroperoxide reductase subunit C) n=1 Tax=Galdieria sulphuraria TaxID=130081 RepID=M2X227_GALSU|nr:peroxiredoxin (alkyl hydroperoxide reductase subunit C) [Galdieria sulphuraria]EME30410.1 peroxiredoxin (alkyl hydroperoxide reductase subunit C) [Galdieria sulphuraria]|eukprot:XP_005706930.1 peroxiredoxin (alkyl hydroperoxide reductase subunit C) [Galdieria sulphuraria]
MVCGFVCGLHSPVVVGVHREKAVSICKRTTFLFGSKQVSFYGNTFQKPILQKSLPRQINLMMIISNGSRFPEDVTFTTLQEGQVKEMKASEIFNGKKVVIFGVPGAFTPSCSDKHLPGFAENFDKFKEKGIDTVICLAANDPYVMNAWAKQKGVDGKILMLSDGSGAVLEELGLSVNTGNFGGRRARRFSAYVENGVVKNLNLENGTSFTETSAAERVLSQIG